MRRTIAFSALIVFTGFVGLSFGRLKAVQLNYGGQASTQLASVQKKGEANKFSGYTDKPSQLSDACVWKILDAVEKSSKTKDYIPKDATASLEWTDENHQSVSITATGSDDGNLTAEIEVKREANGNCKPGKVLNWDFSL